MDKNAVIRKAIELVHSELRSISYNEDCIREALTHLERAPNLITSLGIAFDALPENPSHFITLMHILKETNIVAPYPEIRLLQQWTHMWLTCEAMDDHYTSDFLFSRQRAQLVLSEDENLYLTNKYGSLQHPWPQGWKCKKNRAPDPYLDTISKEPQPNPVLSKMLVMQGGLIESLAASHGITIVTDINWRANKEDRSNVLLVNDSSYTVLDHDSIGVARYLLIGPNETLDVCIEMHHLSMIGTTGTSLLESLDRLTTYRKNHVLPNAIIGVFGYVSPEDFDIALGKAIPGVAILDDLSLFVYAQTEHFSKQIRNFIEHDTTHSKAQNNDFEL